MKITTTLTPRNTSTLPPAVALQLTTLLSQPGAPGIKGSVWYAGSGAPSEEVGFAGDYYIDIVSLCLYGPKTTVWGDDFACIAGTVLDADIQDALAGANAPSAANAFATADDLTAKVDEQSGTILGQRDILTSVAPTDASSTAIDYAIGNAHYLDISALTSSHAITLTASNWPAAATDYAAITLVLKTGATLPTITWPAGWVTLVPAVSKTSEYVVRSLGAAAPRLALVEAY